VIKRPGPWSGLFGSLAENSGLSAAKIAAVKRAVSMSRLTLREATVDIKVLEIADLAELCVELLRHGAAFSVTKHGDGMWHVTLTGF
jgi:hypothetical protein